MVTSANTLTAQGILNTLDEHAAALKSRGVVRIGVFGSQARGDAKPDSDIDILVTLVDHKFKTYCNVLFYLEDLFQCKIDLVPEAQLKPRVKPYVMNDVIYAKGY